MEYVQDDHHDQSGVVGIVVVRLVKADKIIYEEIGKNLVVNTGRTLMLKQLVGGLTADRPYSYTPIWYAALGSDNTPVSSAQTSLIHEEPGPNGVRILATVTSPLVGTLLLTANWDITHNQNTFINEIGLFTNSVTGVGDIMFSRYVLQNEIEKDAFTSFQLSYTITLGAG